MKKLIAALTITLALPVAAQARTADEPWTSIKTSPGVTVHIGYHRGYFNPDLRGCTKKRGKLTAYARSIGVYEMILVSCKHAPISDEL